MFLRRVGFTLSLVVALLAGASKADDSDASKRDEVPTVDSKLFGKLPADFVVHAVGTYNGIKAVNAQLDNSGHEVRQVDVVVNLPKQNVVLVLTAYDPTVWRVGRTPDTRIAGVVVSGYHGQALIGISKGVPYHISTYSVKGNFPGFYAYKASQQLLRMNEQIKELVGKEMTHFVFKPTKDVFYVGTAPEDLKTVEFSNDLSIKEYVKPDQPPAGKDGIELLVQKGLIRPATGADIEAWVDKASEKYRRFNPELRVETYMRHGRAYVVLKECTLPDGLFGAHSVHLIIPMGVPLPGGSRGHNTFYFMDGTAQGPAAAAMD